MVPSGLRETYFFLLSKELGNLRHRDLANNIYHVIIMNVASLGQPPRAPGLALGWGLRPPSLAPPRGSCGRGGGGGSTSGSRGSGKASNQSLIQKTKTMAATPLQFAVLKVRESRCLKLMDLKVVPKPDSSGGYQCSLLAFFHSCLVTCFLMVHKLLDSLATVEELIAHVEEKQ